MEGKALWENRVAREVRHSRAQSGRATGPDLQIALGMLEPKLQEKENNINAVSWRGGYV